jgi:hypothetical protein
MPNGWFRPGDEVPVTGIYTANHDEHRNPHEVFAAEGEKFPNCRVCGTRVTFALSQTASNIDKDKGFGKAAKNKTRSFRKRKEKSAEDG